MISAECLAIKNILKNTLFCNTSQFILDGQNIAPCIQDKRFWHIIIIYTLMQETRIGRWECVRSIVINIIIITVIVMFDRSRGMQNDVTKRKIARACARVRTEIFAYTYICSRDRVNDTQREKNNKKETHSHTHAHTHTHTCIVHIIRCI